MVDLNVTSEQIASSIARHIIERKRFPRVLFMELFLTEDCNLRCTHCFVKGKDARSMSREVAFQAVNFLIEHSRSRKDISILFTGGEPMLEFPLIEELVPYAEKKAKKAEKELSLSMITNGTLFDEEKTRFMADHSVKLVLSIDGCQEDHDANRRFRDGTGSFDAVMSKVPLMKSYQPWLAARYTVYPTTVGNLARNVKELFRNGINQFLIGPAHGVEWLPEHSSIFEEQMVAVSRFHLDMQEQKERFRMTFFEKGDLENTCKQRGVWGCGAGRSRFCVSASGDLFGCSKFRCATGDISQNEGIYKLGNVREGFTDPLKRAEVISLSPEKWDKCLPCDQRDICTGGCPAVNYQETGSIHIPGPTNCSFTRMFSAVTSRFGKEFDFRKGPVPIG